MLMNTAQEIRRYIYIQLIAMHQSKTLRYNSMAAYWYRNLFPQAYACINVCINIFHLNLVTKYIFTIDT
jgi:hypothetical protein